MSPSSAEQWCDTTRSRRPLQEGARYAAAYALLGTTGAVNIDAQLQTEVRNVVVYGNKAGRARPSCRVCRPPQILLVDAGGDQIRLEANYPYVPLFGAVLPDFRPGSSIATVVRHASFREHEGLMNIRWQRGTTTVEFAIIGVVMFSVLFGVIEVGRAMFVMNALGESTRRAARMAAVCPINDPAIRNVGLFNAPGDGSGNGIVGGLSAIELCRRVSRR